MTSSTHAFAANARWELQRLRRSRRIWLLLIPPVAGPIGSASADLYLHVPSAATASVLGLLITAGLASLVILDLSALASAEDLGLRTHYLTFALPQSREAALAGRLAVVLGASFATYGAGAVVVLGMANLFPTTGGAPAPILPPAHLALGLVGLLAFLGGIAAAAGIVARSSSQALVASVLGGVVAGGLASTFLLQGDLTALFPATLAAVGTGGYVIAFLQFHRLDS